MGDNEASQIRAEVLPLFEKHRLQTGSPYEESQFLSSLTSRDGERREIDRSFRATWRLNRFLDEVETEFGVAFSVADRKKDFTLDGFVNRIAHLRRNKRGSLASLRNRGTQSDVSVLITLNFLGLWILALIAVLTEMDVWLYCFGGLLIVVNAALLSVIWKKKRHVDRLKGLIMD